MTLKIIEQTASRLTLQAGIDRSAQRAQLIIAGLSVAIWIVPMVLIASYTGKVSLTCNRTAPERVSCTQDWIPLLGKPQKIPLGHIRSAKIEQSGIMLDTDSGVIPFDIPADPADSFRTKIKNSPYGWLIRNYILRSRQAMDRINRFLNDPQETLLFVEIEVRSMSLHMFLFMAIWNVLTHVFPIWNCFAVRIFEFDKFNSRLTITNKNLRNQQVFQYALDEIIGLRVEQFRASNQISFKTVILLSRQQYPIDYGYNKQQEAERSLEPLRNFLNLPLQILELQNTLFGKNVKPPQSEVIFTGKKGVYYSSNIRALPKVSSDEVEKIDSQFAAIGFELLGDLLCSKYPNIVLRGYVKPGEYIYGTVMQGTSSPWVFEFTTAFARGATLTTTTLPGLRDRKMSKMFSNSYPSLGLRDLLLRHQNRVQQLSQEQGPAIKVGNNLKALAVAIDESPEPGAIDLFFIYCTQFWILIGPGARLAIAGVALLLFLFVGGNVYKGIQINRSSEHPIQQQE